MSGIFHHLLAFVSAATDPFWKYVTLLLHGDGTNGAQNNTFIDSSGNAFTVTRNGSATQGTFSPFGPDWSNQFSSANLSLATATALGTGNTTIEFWFFPTDSSATYRAIYDGRSANNTDTGYGIFQYGLTIEVYGNGLKVATAASAFSANTWVYVALVRTSGTCQLYINGVASGSSGAYSSNLTSTVRKIADSVNTSFPFVGYISNLREVTSALYSGTFTPSTTPLTAITGTSVLTCQSSRFVDNSTNAYAITISGIPSVQRFSPFSMGLAYSTSVIGGSSYFNGSTDSLVAPANTAFAFGQGDFTVQMWIYPTATITSPVNIGLFYIEQTNGLVVGLNNGYIAMGLRVTGYELISNFIPLLNIWTHIAVTRSGATTYIFGNGVLAGTVTSSGGNPANNSNYVCTTGLPTIAGNYAGGAAFGYFPGYISNVQVVKGTAVYTAGFTPPTAPVTAITNTSLLLNYTNAGIYDNAMMNNLITAGNAQISTAQFKFGGASMYFDGTGDYLTTNVPTNNLYVFGPSDFTIEFWLYSVNFSSPNSTQIVVDFRPTSTDGVYPCIYFVSGQIFYYVSSTNVITGTTLSSSQWYHIALSRSGTNTKLFVNGTQVGSTYTDSNSYLCGANRPAIGCRGFLLGDIGYNGYIDDLRITKAARYTANFTPPTTAFPNY